MAKGINKVILVGNLGADPEVRQTVNDNKMATFNLATTESWKDKESGEKIEKTEWHRCVAFSGLAGIVESYCKKGSQIYVEGKNVTREYEKDGIKRYTTEVRVSDINLLGSSSSGFSDGQALNSSTNPPSSPQPTVEFNDDVPF